MGEGEDGEGRRGGGESRTAAASAAAGIGGAGQDDRAANHQVRRSTIVGIGGQNEEALGSRGGVFGHAPPNRERDAIGGSRSAGLAEDTPPFPGEVRDTRSPSGENAYPDTFSTGAYAGEEDDFEEDDDGDNGVARRWRGRRAGPLPTPPTNQSSPALVAAERAASDGHLDATGDDEAGDRDDHRVRRGKPLDVDRGLEAGAAATDAAPTAGEAREGGREPNWRSMVPALFPPPGGVSGDRSAAANGTADWSQERSANDFGAGISWTDAESSEGELGGAGPPEGNWSGGDVVGAVTPGTRARRYRGQESPLAGVVAAANGGVYRRERASDARENGVGVPESEQDQELEENREAEDWWDDSEYCYLEEAQAGEAAFGRGGRDDEKSRRIVDGNGAAAAAAHSQSGRRTAPQRGSLREVSSASTSAGFIRGQQENGSLARMPAAAGVAVAVVATSRRRRPKAPASKLNRARNGEAPERRRAVDGARAMSPARGRGGLKARAIGATRSSAFKSREFVPVDGDFSWGGVGAGGSGGAEGGSVPRRRLRVRVPVPRAAQGSVSVRLV